MTRDNHLLSNGRSHANVTPNLAFKPVTTLPTLHPGMVLSIARDDTMRVYDARAVAREAIAMWWARQIVACWLLTPYVEALAWVAWAEARKPQQMGLFEEAA